MCAGLAAAVGVPGAVPSGARSGERHANAPFLLIRDTPDGRGNAAPFGAEVRDRALFAREQREEFHRHDRGRLRERFEDRFVRDRRARHPLEIGQLSRQRVLAVQFQRRVGHGGRQVSVELDQSDRSGARQTRALFRAPPGAGDHAVYVGCAAACH